MNPQSFRGDGERQERELPVVSILMPAFNVRQFITQAIESVRRQSFGDWELRVVDDGSSDGTYEEALRLAGGDPRITCLQNASNEGIGAARAAALAGARGRLVALMDSDDVAEVRWLENRVRQIDERPDLVGVSGSRLLIDEDGRPLGRTREALSPDAIAWGLLFGNPFCQPSAVLSREAVLRAGGYGRERYLEDWSLFSRLARMGSLLQTNEALIRYRIRGRGASRTVGTDRTLLEETAKEILGANLRGLVTSPIPADLAWVLFRGRRPVEVNVSAARSMAIVLEALSRFLANRRVRDRAGVAAGALLDVANVLRCGGWAPSLAAGAIRSVVRDLGADTLLRRRVARAVAVIAAIPLLTHFGRVRREPRW